MWSASQRSRPTGEDAASSGRALPRYESRPGVAGVEAVAVDEGLCDGDGHLGVVGELAGIPPDPSAADNFDGVTECGFRESGGPFPSGSELERSAERIADRGTEKRTVDASDIRMLDGAIWMRNRRDCQTQTQIPFKPRAARI
jgi:hypothetical protein